MALWACWQVERRCGCGTMSSAAPLAQVGAGGFSFWDGGNWDLKPFSKTCEVSAANRALALGVQSAEQRKPGVAA